MLHWTTFSPGSTPAKRRRRPAAGAVREQVHHGPRPDPAARPGQQRPATHGRDRGPSAEHELPSLSAIPVGAGPTGVEMAGQIAELARETLCSDFRPADPGSGRILRIEAADRALNAFPPSLSAKAERSLRELGVMPECSPCVFGETQGIGGPGCPADLDHDPGNLVTAADLPKPTARVAACGHVPAEVRADLPAHRARLRGMAHAAGASAGPASSSRQAASASAVRRLA